MDPLLQPIEIAGLKFKNRMVHVPTTMNMSDPLGHVTDKLTGVYETLAAGGSGAVIVGATCVRHDGLINERMLGMYDDTYVIGHRDVVSVIKDNGAVAGIQLFYGGMIPGLAATFPIEPGTGWIPGTISWGPSSKAVIGNPEPRVMPTEAYDELVEAYAQGARRASEAGYDSVSWHFCHGSLPHTNLSLIANVGRNDKYADRFLLCERIIERTQELCGKDFAQIPRLCVDENLEGGYDIEYFVEHYAPRLHALGVAVLDCTFGSMLQGEKSRNPEIDSWEYIGPGFYTPNAVNLDNIAKLKSLLKEKGIDMPVVGSANLCTPEDLRAMVSPGHAEFAGTCRLSMDDPEYANKIAEGREEEIRKSTRTGASNILGNIFGKGWAGSAQNPSFGRDHEYRLRPPLSRKKVVIVGGGSGGMEYAITATQIGHEVVLFEKSGALGGAMDWAGNYPNVPNMEIIRYQPDYHRAMMKKLNVHVRLNCAPGVKEILAENPDVVVIATGAEWIMPAFEGLEEAMASGFAVTMERAMSRDIPFDPGARPIVLGSAMGGELVFEYKLRGLDVRLLEPSPVHEYVNYIGSRGARVDGAFAKYGISIEIDSKPVMIADGMLTVENSKGERKGVHASKVIICPPRRAFDPLSVALQGKGVAVQVIGDAKTPRSYANAIHEAAYLSRRL